MSVSVGAYLI